MTHNQTLPNLRKILSDNWSLLKKHVFKEQPIIAYRLKICDRRHYCRKQQSSQKTEARIKKQLLQTVLFKNKQPLLQTSCTGHDF